MELIEVFPFYVTDLLGTFVETTDLEALGREEMILLFADVWIELATLQVSLC